MPVELNLATIQPATPALQATAAAQTLLPPATGLDGTLAAVDGLLGKVESIVGMYLRMKQLSATINPPKDESATKPLVSPEVSKPMPAQTRTVFQPVGTQFNEEGAKVFLSKIVEKLGSLKAPAANVTLGKLPDLWMFARAQVEPEFLAFLRENYALLLAPTESNAPPLPSAGSEAPLPMQFLDDALAEKDEPKQPE